MTKLRKPLPARTYVRLSELGRTDTGALKVSLQEGTRAGGDERAARAVPSTAVRFLAFVGNRAQVAERPFGAFVGLAQAPIGVPEADENLVEAIAGLERASLALDSQREVLGGRGQVTDGLGGGALRPGRDGRFGDPGRLGNSILGHAGRRADVAADPRELVAQRDELGARLEHHRADIGA